VRSGDIIYISINGGFIYLVTVLTGTLSLFLHIRFQIQQNIQISMNVFLEYLQNAA